MSWSASLVVRAGEPEPRDGDVSLNNVDEVPEHLEQYREALSAAFGILLSGVVGGKDKNYTINLSGHGNEGHEPASGWANDMLSITISQVGGLE
ncbi:MAG TPA: hypothetical protein VN039_05545 [Nitrospira sp.]|jgi:hypothetical protein|nr:hypothetical protein [Nitrospira sp.]